MPKLSEYPVATIVGDLALLASIPMVLVAIHVLVPTGLQGRFVLRPDAIEPIALFTSAYLHLTVDHLVSNLYGYAIGAGYAYLLCLWAGERRWFWLTVLTLLLVLPVFVNLTSLWIFRAYYPALTSSIRGFSGVAAGFGGLVFVALVAFLRRDYPRAVVLFTAQSIMLVLLWEILVRFSGTIPVFETVLVAIGVLLSLVEIVRRRSPPGLPETRREWIEHGKTIVIVAWVIVVLTVLVAGFFPSQLVTDGTFTNIFGHAAGFMFGVIISSIGYRYWGTQRASLFGRPVGHAR